jgi:hypothetical protein
VGTICFTDERWVEDMSTLVYRPESVGEVPLSEYTKMVFRKKCGNNTIHGVILTHVDIPYLEGLRDAGCEAGGLISAIEKYGRIILDEKS